ncbi:MAG: glycosyltransferase family 39 protein [candidate division Zixibacteria bacterium]|nr:glycosyltransferase family 39 protein [candidate division Zixibacteria bacterium]
MRNMKSQSKKKKKKAAKPQVPVDKKSALTEFFKNPFFSSRAFEILLFCFIIGLAFVGGVLFLSADPPHISWSQDVATDPPQYTYFARNNVLWGSWDLFGHNRFIFFLKSFSTAVSYLVFSVFGTGRFQANLVAVILNLLTMVFLFLTLKKIFSKRAAYLSLFFLGINFVFIMYGRNPFLEISALFLLVLGFYFMVSSFPMDPADKRNLLLIPSGICFAAGIFFGKTMAAFILPACLGVLLLWIFEHFSSSKRKMNFKPLIFFGSGFLLVLLFWLFFAYLPAKKEVAGYFGEQAFGLYGFPKALQSISGFVSSLFTFGTDLFYRMPVVFLLSFLGLLLFFSRNPSIKKLIENRDHRSKAKFLLVFWFLVAFFLLMSLNYRPLRYQLYLIPPMCALAGLWLDSFLSSFGSKRNSSLGILFWVVFVIGVTFFVNYVITTYHILSLKQIQLSSSLGISFIITLFCGVLYYWRFARSRKVAKESKPKEFKLLSLGHRFLIMLVLILISLVVNGWQYLSWASSPTYSLNRSSVDLGKILSKEAVVSGPYGPALVWDNKLKNVIHMFGVTQPDPKLFHTYPITHLALERGGNRDRAFKDYSEVMREAKIVTTYWLRNIPVDIYRIGEWTGNPETEKYPLSDFEKAKMLMEVGETDSALVLLEEFVSRSPENFSVYRTLAEIYYEMKEFEKAALSLEQAAKFNPTDFSICQQLGLVYLNLMNQTGEDNYRLLAIDQWEKAIKLFPQNTNLAVELQRIKEY